MEKERKSLFERFLEKVEYVGNKIPHPTLLFLWLMGITIVLSFIFSVLNITAVNPVTGEVIEAYNLLSVKGFVKMLVTAQGNFTGVSALGMVLVCMMGVSLCEQSGLFRVALKGTVENSRGSDLKVMVIFFICCVLADCAGGAGWVVLPPLGAMIWLSIGRNPLAGMFAAYATTASAFCANILVTSMDIVNLIFTQTEIYLLDKNYHLSAAFNWFFSSAAAVLLVPVSLYVTIKIVEPRMGKYNPEYAQEGTIEGDVPIKEAEMKALKTAGFVFVGYLAVVAALTVIGVLRDPETGSPIASAAPLMKGLPFLIALLFFIPGVVYGKVSGAFKGSKDVARALGQAMADMGPYIALIFVSAQFLKYFEWSNMGIILAIKGADFLEASGLPIPVVLVLFIIMCALINMLIGGASTKWAILSPIFVPMFMFLGYHPALAQMAYRIGDSITNPICPTFAYFGMLLALSQKYDKNAGFGTLMANMLPYTIAFFCFMTIQLLIWFILGIPFGPGAPLRLS